MHSIIIPSLFCNGSTSLRFFILWIAVWSSSIHQLHALPLENARTIPYQPTFYSPSSILRCRANFLKPLHLHHNHNNENIEFAPDDMNYLKDRLQALQLQVLEHEVSRPPNAQLEPIQVVRTIMEGLWNAYDPLPDSGFRLLLHSSTPKWRNEIFKRLGVPIHKKNDCSIDKKGPNVSTQRKNFREEKSINFELVASALGSSMGRPHNQFAILVNGDDDEGYHEDPEYILDFSASESQLLDFGDGTCWVECRLRDKISHELLVLTGWDLMQCPDGAWMVDWIYWQDFREEFRPGIGGRQEWLVNVNE